MTLEIDDDYGVQHDGRLTWEQASSTIDALLGRCPYQADNSAYCDWYIRRRNLITAILALDRAGLQVSLTVTREQPAELVAAKQRVYNAIADQRPEWADERTEKEKPLTYLTGGCTDPDNCKLCKAAKLGGPLSELEDLQHAGIPLHHERPIVETGC